MKLVSVKKFPLGKLNGSDRIVFVGGVYVITVKGIPFILQRTKFAFIKRL